MQEQISAWESQAITIRQSFERPSLPKFLPINNKSSKKILNLRKKTLKKQNFLNQTLKWKKNRLNYLHTRYSKKNCFEAQSHNVTNISQHQINPIISQKKVESKKDSNLLHISMVKYHHLRQNSLQQLFFQQNYNLSKKIIAHNASEFQLMKTLQKNECHKKKLSQVVHKYKNSKSHKAISVFSFEMPQKQNLTHVKNSRQSSSISKKYLMLKQKNRSQSNNNRFEKD